jgi:flagellar assembly protein FliH
MKSSSTDPTVRPARFDRPLAHGMSGAGSSWGDPRIDLIVARAAEEAREAARGSGYAVGWAQGRQAAAEAERVEADRRRAEDAACAQADAVRLEAVLRALDGAAAQVRAASAPAWADLADTLVDGVLELARTVLGRELATVDALLAEQLRIALRTLGEAPGLTVRLNPTDLALVTAVPMPDGVALVADPSVPAGSVQAQTPTQRLLVDLPAALERAMEVLRG